jgi:hypothetical protein
MNYGDKTTRQQQPADGERIASRPQKFQLKLLEKTSHRETDITSFRFTSSDEKQNLYLNYKAGQYSVVDLGTKEDPEGSLRSFTIASSPTEKDFILISTRIRGTPFKKKLANLDLGNLVKITAPMGKFVLPDDHSLDENFQTSFLVNGKFLLSIIVTIQHNEVSCFSIVVLFNSMSITDPSFGGLCLLVLIFRSLQINLRMRIT